MDQMTESEVEAARTWLATIGVFDDRSEIDDLASSEVADVIAQHHPGGVAAFIARP